MTYKKTGKIPPELKLNKLKRDLFRRRSRRYGLLDNDQLVCYVKGQFVEKRSKETGATGLSHIPFAERMKHVITYKQLGKYPASPKFTMSQKKIFRGFARKFTLMDNGELVRVWKG